MDPGKPSSRASRASWALAAITLCAVACLWAVPALPDSGDKPDEFRRGILAAKRRAWARSAELMHVANHNQEENGQLVKISSSNYVHYLPLYHQGVALYKLNRCQDALAVWQQSIKLGFVTQHRDETKDLAEYRRDCLNRLNRR